MIESTILSYLLVSFKNNAAKIYCIDCSKTKMKDMFELAARYYYNENANVSVYYNGYLVNMYERSDIPGLVFCVELTEDGFEKTYTVYKYKVSEIK